MSAWRDSVFRFPSMTLAKFFLKRKSVAAHIPPSPRGFRRVMQNSTFQLYQVRAKSVKRKCKSKRRFSPFTDKLCASGEILRDGETIFVELARKMALCYRSVARTGLDSEFQNVDAVEMVYISRSIVGVCEIEAMMTGGNVNHAGPLFAKRVPQADVTVQILKEFPARTEDFEERGGLPCCGKEPLPSEMAPIAKGHAGWSVNRYGQCGVGIPEDAFPAPNGPGDVRVDLPRMGLACQPVFPGETKGRAKLLGQVQDHGL